MHRIIKTPHIIALLLLALVGTSCSSNRSYAQRKKSKYSNTRSVVKSKSSRTGSTYSTRRPNTNRSAIVTTAKKYLGKKYVYGGKTPSGFDCSGFTAYVYQQHGIDLSGPSHAQAKAGKQVGKSEMQTGDLIFFGRGKVSHVGIVAEVGSNTLQIIHSSSSKGVVIEDIANSPYWQSRYLFARNVIGGDYASR